MFGVENGFVTCPCGSGKKYK
ncbi:SEC-C metal-binding domain-containing protein [Siminovitchia fortis]